MPTAPFRSVRDMMRLVSPAVYPKLTTVLIRLCDRSDASTGGSDRGDARPRRQRGRDDAQDPVRGRRIVGEAVALRESGGGHLQRVEPLARVKEARRVLEPVDRHEVPPRRIEEHRQPVRQEVDCSRCRRTSGRRYRRVEHRPGVGDARHMHEVAHAPVAADPQLAAVRRQRVELLEPRGRRRHPAPKSERERLTIASVPVTVPVV